MASITWPSTLPAPLSDGYRETPPDTTMRTSMDAGPDKVRRRYTSGSRPFALRYHLTATQVATLETFYTTTSRSGSLLFNWTHPRSGATVEARFLGAPQYAAIEHEGDVSVAIEVMP